MSKMDEIFNEAISRFKVQDIGFGRKIYLLIKYVLEVMGWTFLQVLILKGVGVGVFTKTFQLLTDNKISVNSYYQTWVGLMFSLIIIAFLAAQLYFIFKNINKIWSVVTDKFVMIIDTQDNSYHITTADCVPKILAEHMTDDVMEEK